MVNTGYGWQELRITCGGSTMRHELMSRDHPASQSQLQNRECGGHVSEGSYLITRDMYSLLICLLTQQMWISRMCWSLY